MEMMNRLMSDALDSQKFVEKIKAAENQMRDEVMAFHRAGESRTERRARERKEAKAARKSKT